MDVVTTLAGALDLTVGLWVGFLGFFCCFGLGGGRGGGNVGVWMAGRWEM